MRTLTLTYFAANGHALYGCGTYIPNVYSKDDSSPAEAISDEDLEESYIIRVYSPEMRCSPPLSVTLLVSQTIELDFRL